MNVMKMCCFSLHPHKKTQTNAYDYADKNKNRFGLLLGPPAGKKNLSETFLKMRTVFMLSESGGLRAGWWIDDSKWTAVEVFRRTLSQSVFVSWFIRMNERCAVAPGRGVGG